jgi:hypothetical protein
MRLLVRRFRCIDPSCSQGIFCERLPGLLDAHARSTARLTDAHRAIGFALGGEAGARLAEHLDMPASPDTLLRRVKDAADEPAPAPRYVGIDDWAIRKGHRYGTILIDLERGRVIDILEGRDGKALTVWLKDHPGVEVITRDRWPAYAQAAARGRIADLMLEMNAPATQCCGRLSSGLQHASTGQRGQQFVHRPQLVGRVAQPKGDIRAGSAQLRAPGVVIDEARKRYRQGTGIGWRRQHPATVVRAGRAALAGGGQRGHRADLLDDRAPRGRHRPLGSPGSQEVGRERDAVT